MKLLLKIKMKMNQKIKKKKKLKKKKKRFFLIIIKILLELNQNFVMVGYTNHISKKLYLLKKKIKKKIKNKLFSNSKYIWLILFIKFLAIKYFII